MTENKIKNTWKKNASLFITGQSISLFGSMLVQYAFFWYITLKTQSGLYLTITALCGFLPQVIISLFAGVWADRYNKKKLIIISDISTAFFTLVLSVCFLFGYRELWLIFTVMAIRSLGAGIQTPAVSAAVPSIVPEDKLFRVNGISSSIQSASMIIAPAISGALYTALPLEYIFLIDIITAALAVLFISRIRIPYLPQKEKKNVLTDLKEGLSYIRGNNYILLIFAFFTVFAFFVTPSAFLTPLMVTRSYGSELWRLTVNEIAFGGGATLGGIIIARWGGFKSRIKTISLSCAIFGVFTVFMGTFHIFYVYLSFLFLTGISMPFFNTTSTVLLQEKVEPSMLGRVFGLMSIVFAAAMPLGMLIFGPIADIIRIELLLIITGVIIMLLGAAILFNKKLKNL